MLIHRLARRSLIISLTALLAACGGDSSSPAAAMVADNASGGGSTTTPPSGPDFTEVDASFQSFIDGNEVFDGISYVLVDAEGILHQGVFGDHTADTVVMLASTSKVPAVMTTMALQDDPNVSFSMSEPVSTHLPYDGVYADRTVEQLVSNTSGIPGLRLLAQYG